MSNQKSGFDRRHALPVVGLYVLGIVIYLNTFSVPFVFDDIPNIVENPAAQLRVLSVDGLYRAAFEGVSARRPVANLSFALNHWLGGFDVRGYHLVNVLVHIANGLLVYALCVLLLPRVCSGAAPRVIRAAALVVAALFIAHPLQTQAVTYIVQRMTSLCALFYLTALLLFVIGRMRTGPQRWLAWGTATLSGLLALATKEIAATLPLALLLVEWCFFRRAEWRLSAAACGWTVLAAGCVSVTALVYLGADPMTAVAAPYADREFTLAERLLTELRVLFFYLGLAGFPSPERLNLLHTFSVSHGWLQPVSTALAGAGLLILLATAVYGVGRYPVLVFAIGWLLLTLVIESSVIGLELVYEHRMYLPLAGLSIAVGAVLAWLAGRTAVVWFAAAGLVLLLSTATYFRNAVWADEVTLWVDVASKSPASARAHNNLGRALLRVGERDEAVSAFNRALFLKPDYAEPNNNLGVMYAAERQYAIAIGYLERALELQPRSAQTRHNLGMALADIGRSADAIDQLRQAIVLDPRYAKAHIGLATLLARSGERSRACEHLHAAWRLNPTPRLEAALAHCRDTGSD